MKKAQDRVKEIVSAAFDIKKNLELGTMIETPNGLCLDFETGKDNNEIVEIGLIDSTTGREFTTLVKLFYQL